MQSEENGHQANNLMLQRLNSHANSKINMNDTFAQWKNQMKCPNPQRTSKSKNENINNNEQLIVPPIILQKNSKTKNTGSKRKRDFKGMTLEQYFKERANQQQQYQSKTEHMNKHNHTVRHQQIQQYQQDDQEAKPVKTPQFNELPNIVSPTGRNEMQKRLLQKYSKKIEKIRTETQDDFERSIEFRSRQKSKHRMPTVISNEEKNNIPLNTLTRIEFRQTFNEATKRDNKISKLGIHKPSNKKKHYNANNLSTLSDFYKDEPGKFKKNKILEKVQNEKEELNDLKASEIGIIMKYGSKLTSTSKPKQYQLRL